MVNANGRSSTEEKLDFQEKQTVSKKVNIWVKKKSFNTGGGGHNSVHSTTLNLDDFLRCKISIYKTIEVHWKSWSTSYECRNILRKK